MSQNFAAILLNLDRDAERRIHMERELAQAGIAFTRQPGILGNDVPADLRHFFYDANGDALTTMKRGEIGCYASHLRALMRIAGGECGSAALIMEDDLAIAPGALADIEEAIRQMPRGWDILRLSSLPRRAYVPLAPIGTRRLLVRYSKIPNGAGAYLVTQQGAQKFLTHGVRGLTFDDDLRRPWFHHMDTYGLMPPPMKPGMLPSTIDAVEGGRFDKPMSSRTERLMRGDHLYALKRLVYNVGNLGVGNWLACGFINLADMVIKPVIRRSIIHGAAWLSPRARRRA